MNRLVILVTVLAGVLASWIGRRRVKAASRRLAIGVCQRFLRWRSEPYELRPVSCIVFAPHQDDETLGCGALIARKRNEGLPVNVAFITDGGASHSGHPFMSPGQMGTLRRREALAALAILGVESCAIHFLEEPDGTLNNLPSSRRGELVARLATLIARVKPSEIFLPCSPDGSSEHDAAFGFICEAVQQANARPDIWQYPVWSWWNPGLLIERLLSNHGYCGVPTEDYHPIKVRALDRYRSQMEPTPPWNAPALPPELVRSCSSDHEFFFRFVLPAAGPGSRPAAMI